MYGARHRTFRIDLRTRDYTVGMQITTEWREPSSAKLGKSLVVYEALGLSGAAGHSVRGTAIKGQNRNEADNCNCTDGPITNPWIYLRRTSANMLPNINRKTDSFYG